MTWLCVDDKMVRHEKIEVLSDAAYRALMRMWSYCAERLTDGFVPTEAAMLCCRYKDEVLFELMQQPVNPKQSPLIQPCDRGYMVHDYLEYNRSRVQVEADRARNAERQAALRDRRRNGVSNGVTTTVTNGASSIQSKVKDGEGLEGQDQRLRSTTEEQPRLSTAEVLKRGILKAHPGLNQSVVAETLTRLLDSCGEEAVTKATDRMLEARNVKRPLRYIERILVNAQHVG